MQLSLGMEVNAEQARKKAMILQVKAQTWKLKQILCLVTKTKNHPNAFLLEMEFNLEKLLLWLMVPLALFP